MSSSPDISIHRVLIRLRLTGGVSFDNFYHSGPIHAVLHRACDKLPAFDAVGALALPGGNGPAGGSIPIGIVPTISEAGRVRFAAGDDYHLGLTLVDEAAELLPVLLDGIGAVGGARRTRVLEGNFTIDGVEVLPSPDLVAELEALAAQTSVNLHLLSPLRLEYGRRKPKEFAQPGTLDLAMLVARTATRARLFLPDLPEEMPRPLPPTPAEPGTVWRVAAPVYKEVGNRRARRKTATGFAGLVGRLELPVPPEPWHLPLVLAQHLHIGSHVNYGYGRVLIAACTEVSPDPFHRSRSFQAEADAAEALDRAADHVLSDSTAAGVDGQTVVSFNLSRDKELSRLGEELRSGTYRPAPLLGILGAKDDGGVRALAIPTVRDRIAQRAANQALLAGVDTLLETCSIAYRPGLSRRAARVFVESSYRDGYRYAFQADIQSFFDSVQWNFVAERLRAFFPDEPLVERILDWVHSPIIFEGQHIERTRGLPQGSAVSPLLANLLLDHFDEELLERGFRLVRYADDFLILCRTPEDLDLAREAAEEALAGLGLTLHPEKTQAASLDQGIRYLGYLFCRSLVLESSDPHTTTPTVTDIERSALPAHSWALQVPTSRLSEAVRGKERRVRFQPLDREHRTRDDRMPVFITGSETRVFRSGDTLRLESGGDAKAIPTERISHLVLLGNTRATLPLLRRLAQQGKPTFLCRRSGELEGLLLPRPGNWRFWSQQASASQDQRFRLSYTRAVVEARLHGMATVLVRRRDLSLRSAAAEIRECQRQTRTASSVDTLRGLEGMGTNTYFGAWANFLDAVWGFSGRQRRPPPDPVNAMLSLGSYVLHHQAATALLQAELNPGVGLYHSDRGRHMSLASDHMEEFRLVIESEILRIVRRGLTRPDDFVSSGNGQCRFRSGPLRAFLGWIDAKLRSRLTHRGRKISYQALMARQAADLRHAMRQGARYRPYRPHA